MLAKYDHSLLIFTAPTAKGLEPYKGTGVETRVADFNNPDNLVEAFKGADTMILISMPFVGPRRRKVQKAAIAAAYAAMSDWSDRVVDVNGAEPLTIGEYIEIANQVIGHHVKYVEINDE